MHVSATAFCALSFNSRAREGRDYHGGGPNDNAHGFNSRAREGRDGLCQGRDV